MFKIFYNYSESENTTTPLSSSSLLLSSLSDDKIVVTLTELEQDFFCGGAHVVHFFLLRFSRYFITAISVISSFSFSVQILLFKLIHKRFSVVTWIVLNLLSDKRSVSRLNALSTVEFTAERHKTNSANMHKFGNSVRLKASTVFQTLNGSSPKWLAFIKLLKERHSRRATTSSYPTKSNGCVKCTYISFIISNPKYLLSVGHLLQSNRVIDFKTGS